METQEKIAFLVKTLDSEVGWFGTVVASESDKGHMVYTLQPDLLIYPQIVTGATVKPDDEGEAYDKWWIDQLRTGKIMTWHGHSHCNMGCYPSSTDDNLRKNLNSDGGIHIYTIHNKAGGIDLEVFDGTTEILSVVQDGDNPIEHEDIIMQLGRVKHRSYVAPVATRAVTPYRTNIVPYGGEEWQGGYNRFDKYIDNLAQAQTSIIDINMHEVGPEDALCIAAVEETMDNIDLQDIPDWAKLELQEELENYAEQLIDNLRESFAEQSICPVCGNQVAEGVCETCGARYQAPTN